ncbi:MAG TPA: TonB-dependent receptor, partial [Bryobacteraceae bacterium]|nr:TonB-dependent receptor [Bryobacteraceae bacterium]
PVKKDKLFLFGGYEHLLRGLPSANTIDPTLAAQIGINPALLATADSVQHVQFFNIRADWIINDKHQLFARYNYFRNEFPFNTAVGALNALDVAADFKDRAHVVGLQLLSTFSSNLLNELRASEPYRNQTHVANPLDGPGPQVVITGIATFNGTSAIGDRFAEKIPSFSDNVTWIKGRHTFKAGFGFQENNDNQVGNVFSRYTFSSIANYLAAKNGTNPLSYSTFATVLGVPGLSYKTHFYNFFAQDSWQIKPNFLLIYGVRYDRYSPPDANPNAPLVYSREFRSPGGNFAPRVGFAWQIRPKFVLRVNSGIFYEAPATNLWYNALNNDGSTRSFQTSLAPTAAGAPRFPNVFNGSATLVTPSPTAVTPNFKNAYTINNSIQIEREFTNNDTLKVGYVHTAARNMVFLRNSNLINPISFLADGRPVFSGTVSAATRLFPQFNGINLQDTGAISDYNALIVYYQHRIGKSLQLNASYTWSHSISDAPDVNSFEQNAFISDPTNRTRDRGNPVSNRPSALLLSSVINPTVKLDSRFWNALANGNMLTFLANLASGDQQNITTGTLLNGDSLAGAVQRPLFIGRGTARTKGLYQVDARYTRTIFSYRERLHARVLAEATNLFNRKNVTVINTTAGTNSAGVITSAPTFAPTSSVLESRILQLGLKIDF